MFVFKLIGWVIVILVACLALCGGIVFLERKFPGKAYDERQVLARGKAFQHSLVVGSVYFVVMLEVMIWQVEKETVWIEPYLVIFWGLLLQCLVLNIYCLLTGSALPWDDKGDLTILMYFGIAFMNLIGWIGHPPVDSLPLTGKGSSVWIGLSFGLTNLVLGVLHIIRRLVKDRE